MKQKDIALIIVIAVIAGIVSFFVAKLIFVPPKKMTAEVATPITTEFPQPDKKYFNAQSVNPTRQISIGDSNNSTPFSGGAQR